MAESKSSNVPREGYRPEWLALEDATGGRIQPTGDFDVDCPAFDNAFSALAKQWPPLDEELDVWDEQTDESCNNTEVRIYKPKAESGTPLPLMIYFHGGGFFAGTLDTEDAQCRYFAAKTPCLVISVEYPKVVEPGVNLDKIINQFAVPSVPWCRKRAKEIGADPSKTFLCGGSAGAMLSSEVAYHYMEKGDTSSVTGLVLLFLVVFPYTYGENGKHKEKFKAWAENGHSQVPIVTRPLVEIVWPHYESDFSSPRHFPGLAEDHSKWPPTYMVTAEKDVFRDDGTVLDELLRQCGVVSKLDHYRGLPHYFHMFPTLPIAHEMMAASVEGVRFLLSKQRPL